MTLTIQRPTIQIKGHYTPSKRMYGRKTSAVYKIIDTVPKVDHETINIYACEWLWLAVVYEWIWFGKLILNIKIG